MSKLKLRHPSLKSKRYGMKIIESKIAPHCITLIER